MHTACSLTASRSICHARPPPCMPPCHAHTPPCMPHCHARPPPVDRILDTHFWKYYLTPTSLRAVKMLPAGPRRGAATGHLLEHSAPVFLESRRGGPSVGQILAAPQPLRYSTTTRPENTQSLSLSRYSTHTDPLGYSTTTRPENTQSLSLSRYSTHTDPLGYSTTKRPENTQSLPLSRYSTHTDPLGYSTTKRPENTQSLPLSRYSTHTDPLRYSTTTRPVNTQFEEAQKPRCYGHKIEIG